MVVVVFAIIKACMARGINHHNITVSSYMNETQDLPNLENTIQDYQSLPVLKTQKQNSLEKLEAGLERARASIREAYKAANQTLEDPDYIPSGSIYWNPNAFHRSYLEMEKQFKVYIYEEGNPPVFHHAPCDGILGMEGIFINDMEISRFRTRNPEKAHVFFLPFSVVSIVHFVYVVDSHLWGPMKNTAIDYVNVIAEKYPYWNRALELITSCSPAMIGGLKSPLLSLTCTRIRSGSMQREHLGRIQTFERCFHPRDLSSVWHNRRLVGGATPIRTYDLGFLLGRSPWLHSPSTSQALGKQRPGCENPTIPPERSLVLRSGTEKQVLHFGEWVGSGESGMVEALYMGCVPVLVKDPYAAPFNDVLNWKEFSIDVPVKDIPKLKEILLGIPEADYLRLQRNGVLVRKHFEVNFPPKRNDVFHMILHSIWLRRLDIRIHDTTGS